jgi:dihydroorotase
VQPGLADGALDAIATDHAPHDVLENEVEFDRAANGIIGLESALALSLKLVRDDVLSIETLVDRMALAPARILGLERGVRKGLTADLTLIDPKCLFTLEPDALKSKSRNTPFAGWKLQGRAVMTLVDGRPVHDELKEQHPS